MIFLFIYGFLFFLSSMALLGCIAAAAVIGWRYRLGRHGMIQEVRDQEGDSS